MRVPLSKPAFTAAFVLLLAAGQVCTAETLRVAGTGGAMGMMRQVASAFAESSGIELEFVPGLGSKGAIRATADGALDLAVSARLLAPDETARGLTAVPFARTALVFITSKRKPNSIKSSEITSIFKSSNPKWADGSPINLILRTRFDGDTLLLEQSFVDMHDAIDEARKRTELPIAATDQDSADLAESLAGSFVQGGLGQIVAEKRNLRFVPIDDVEPSLANLESGKYPYDKIFYLVFPAKNKASAERLLDFIKSTEGRAILRATGNLPATE